MKKQKRINIRFQFTRNNFILYFCCFTLPILLLGGFFFYKVYNKSLQEVQRNLSLSLNEAVDTLLTFTHESRIVGEYFQDSGNLLLLSQVLNTQDTMDYETASNRAHLYKFILSIRRSSPQIHSISLYIPNEKQWVFSSNSTMQQAKNIENHQWIDQLLSRPQSTIWTAKRQDRNYNFEEQIPLITIYQTFRSYRGGMVVNYQADALNKRLHSVLFSPQQQMVLLDYQGNILTGSTFFEETVLEQAVAQQEPADGTLFLQGEKYLIKAIDIPLLQAQMVTLLPVKQLYIDSLKENAGLLGVSLVLTFISMAFALVTARKQYAQLNSMIQTMEGTQVPSDFDVQGMAPTDLYSQVQHNIIRAYLEKNTLEQQLALQKYEQKSAELMALQYQINPHFLFNTMQAINYEIYALSDGKYTQANQMVENLSDILRFSLSSGQHTVTLGEEITQCKKYIHIQKIRYDHQFHVVWEVDDSLYSYQILRLVLQPLVENSILHGIRYYPYGNIKIKIYAQNQLLQVRVIDSGCGMRPEKLDAINQALGRKKGEKTIWSNGSIGLLNCHYRLQLYYGPEHGLSIWSKQNRGTVVSFTLPLE